MVNRATRVTDTCARPREPTRAVRPCHTSHASRGGVADVFLVCHSRFPCECSIKGRVGVSPSSTSDERRRLVFDGAAAMQRAASGRPANQSALSRQPINKPRSFSRAPTCLPAECEAPVPTRDRPSSGLCARSRPAVATGWRTRSTTLHGGPLSWSFAQCSATAGVSQGEPSSTAASSSPSATRQPLCTCERWQRNRVDAALLRCGSRAAKQHYKWQQR